MYFVCFSIYMQVYPCWYIVQQQIFGSPIKFYLKTDRDSNWFKLHIVKSLNLNSFGKKIQAHSAKGAFRMESNLTKSKLNGLKALLFLIWMLLALFPSKWKYIPCICKLLKACTIFRFLCVVYSTNKGWGTKWD